jgi:hypothetical protein
LFHGWLKGRYSSLACGDGAEEAAPYVHEYFSTCTSLRGVVQLRSERVVLRVIAFVDASALAELKQKEMS